MAEQPDDLVLEILRNLRVDFRGLRDEMKSMREDMATKADLNALRSEVKADLNSLRADVASDLLITRKELIDKIEWVRKESREQIDGVRRALTDYHSAVIGHGVLISDLEERVRRTEQRLDMPPPGAD